MAVTVANLGVSLTARTKGFSKGMKRAEKSLNRFVGRLGTFGVRMGAVTAAATGAGIAYGVKLASDLEQSRVAFTTMMGSAEAANKVLKDVGDFAATTPFQFPELVGATRNLLAFGIAQERLLPSLRSIGDIAAGVSAPIGEIAEIYGKARVQGQLFAEDINQLTGRGIPVIAEFARQLGVTQAEVKGLASEGKITFSNLEQAFKSLTAEGGQFAGLMEAQSQTLAGQFSTLKDNIGFILRDIGTALLPSLKAMVSRLNEMVPRLREVALQLVPVFARGAEAAASQLDRVGTAITFAANAVKVLRVGALRVLITLSEWLDTVKNFLDNVSRTVGAAMGSIYHLVTQVSRNMQSAFSQVGANAVQIFRNLAESAQIIFDGLFKAIEARDFSRLQVALSVATRKGVTDGVKSIRLEKVTAGILPELVDLDKDSGFTVAFKKALETAEKDLASSTGLAGKRFEAQASSVNMAALELDKAATNLEKARDGRQSLGRTLGRNEFVDVADTSAVKAQRNADMVSAELKRLRDKEAASNAERLGQPWIEANRTLQTIASILRNGGRGGTATNGGF